MRAAWVSIAEIEALFSEGPIGVRSDEAHSAAEERFQAIGVTMEGRHVFIVFTIRAGGTGPLLRPISARSVHHEEIVRYEEAHPELRQR